MVAYERPRRDIGFHFVDQVAREAKSVAGLETITANSYTVRSTINPQLQRAVETTLQEGLSRYERSAYEKEEMKAFSTRCYRQISVAII